MPGARGASGAAGPRGAPGDAGRAGEPGPAGLRVSLLLSVMNCHGSNLTMRITERPSKGG